MSYSVNFREMTVHINPLNVVKYLNSLNWRVLPRKNEAIKVLQREIGGKLFQVNIPMDETLFDYKDAMYDSIATIAESEGKSLEEVFLYLLNPNSDISEIDSIFKNGNEQGISSFDINEESLSFNREKKLNVIYCRVSNNSQKDDLTKQKQLLLDYCNSNGIIVDKIFSEIASGMNEDRKKFNEILELVIQDKIEKIFVTYKDRLTRFGFKYFENLCRKFNTEIIVINNQINEENFEKELVDDLISIIHHFSMKMYSNRRKQFNKIQNILKEGENIE